MVTMSPDVDFFIYVMFWTLLAMMLVLIYSLKQVIVTQRYIQNIDVNIESLVKRTLEDEERILRDIEGKPSKKR